MLLAITLYFIGKYFYVLATDHNRSKWLYAISGILSFFAGYVILGILLGCYGLITDDWSYLEVDDVILDLICIPFAIATSILFYMWLRHRWSKSSQLDTLDEWEV